MYSRKPTLRVGLIVLVAFLQLSFINIFIPSPAAAPPPNPVTITFEEPGIELGYIGSVTKGGVTVRFITRASVIRPAVATQSGSRALINSRQDPVGDETGFQKPFIFEFDRLQQRVRISVGLNAEDVAARPPAPPVGAHLVAYDNAGREIAADRRVLGVGPTPITTPLEVRASGDVIRRVLLEYDSNNAEVLDDIEFESARNIALPPDNVPPVVTILSPSEGTPVNSSTLNVRGRIFEVSGVSLNINGTAVPVRRSDANNYEFNAEITLPAGSNRIEARATDEAGLVGEAHRTLELMLPSAFTISEVRFTQTGLLNGPLLPTRRVAEKTSLFRVGLGIRTADDRQSWVDGAEIAVDRGSGTPSVVMPGYIGRTGMRFPSYGRERIDDARFVYFFINGTWLPPMVPLRFTLRLRVGNRVVFERVLASDWAFRSMPGITLLISPQARPFDADYTRAMMQMLAHFARIYPVADGVVSLDSDERGGIRFAVLPPVAYGGHTDPADPIFTLRRIDYDQAFLLHDHNVGTDAGVDSTYGTPDDPFTFWAGEYLPINFTSAEDSDRSGSFSAEELARVTPGGTNAAVRRISNWDNFVRTAAESQRQSWNRSHSWERQAKRVTILLTDQQDRTGWKGSAATGSTTSWAEINLCQSLFDPHEVGHTYGLDHSASCTIPGAAVDLLTRMPTTSPNSLMCPLLGCAPESYFLLPEEYDQLYDRFAAGEERLISSLRPPVGDGAAPLMLFNHLLTQGRRKSPDGDATFVLIGSITADDKVEISESFLTMAEMVSTEPATDKTYSLAFLNKEGALLAEDPFPLTFKTEDQPISFHRATFAVARPFPNSTASVEVRRKGQALAKLALSANLPSVSKVSVGLIKGAKDAREIRIKWQGSDPDGDDLTYSVSYSMNGGKTFLPLQGGLKANTFSYSRAGLPGGRQALVKVIASDGFRTAESISNIFSLPRLPPVPAIILPGKKAELFSGEEITLYGMALDAEDGMVKGESLEWILIGPKGEQSRLGSGERVSTKPFPEGKYIIQLIAKDQDGQRGVDQQLIVIKAAQSVKADKKPMSRDDF